MKARSKGRAGILVVALLALVPALRAQFYDSSQPIPKEDLALKDNPADPGSAAMILERQIYTDDEKRWQTEWVRIKVFTEEGRANADVEIPYSAKTTTIEGIQGRTIQPDGTVIVFNGTVFDKVVLKYKRFRYETKAFTLPVVQVGSVIEYAYTIRWKESLPDYVRNPGLYAFEEGWTIPTATWTIQQELFTRHALFVLRPVKNAHIEWAEVRMPNRSEVSREPTQNFTVNLQHQLELRPPILKKSADSSGANSAKSASPTASSEFTSANPSWQADGSVRMEVRDVRAIEQEEYMPPEAILNSRVHFYYVVGFVGNYWPDLGKILAKRAEKFIEKTHSLEQAANQIAPAGAPPEERLRKLYARVQQIRYLSYEPQKTEKEVKREHLAENKSAEDILHRGYGYANEINYLFTALARAAGFDASIVQVVDRASGKFEKGVRDASQLNAIVVLVRLNGKELYFDPATRFCPYNLVPWFETDTHGVRWDKVNGEVLDVAASANDVSAIERSAELNLLPDGSLEGTMDVSFTGQEALDRRLAAADEDEAGRRKRVEDEIKTWTPPGITVDVDAITGWQESEQPLRVKCHFHAARFAVLSQQRMVFPLAVFQANRRSPFTHAYRTRPVYFRHGYSEVDKIKIALPPGYRLEAIPAEARDSISLANFQQQRTSETGAVRLERRAVMTGYYLPPEYFALLRQYFERLRESDAQSVVLHKLETAQAH